MRNLGRINRSVIARVSVIALLGACAYLTASSVAGRFRPPRGVVTPTHQRLVAAWPPDPLVATYEVKNTGGKPLILGEPSTTCNCSVPTIDPSVIAPGQRGTIVVVGDPPEAGERQITVRVPTNLGPDGDLILKLTMVGTRPAPFVLNTTEAVHFGQLDGAGAEEIVIISTLENESALPWLQGATCSSTDLVVDGSLEQERSYTDGIVNRRYRYSVSAAKRPDRDLEEELLVWSRDDEEIPQVRIPVRATVPPAIRAIPGSVFSSPERNGRVQPVRLKLIASDPAFDLHVESIVAESDEIQVTAVPDQEEGLGFEIGSVGGLVRPISTSISFHTNHPSAREVRIPVVFLASDSDE